jgi:hypothetical protein
LADKSERIVAPGQDGPLSGKAASVRERRAFAEALQNDAGKSSSAINPNWTGNG